MEKVLQPTIEELHELDAAVLLQKITTVLGMIQNGTPEQKERAKKELEILQEEIQTYVNQDAFLQARRNLGISDEEMQQLYKNR